jgi:hypothetical protein
MNAHEARIITEEALAMFQIWQDMQGNIKGPILYEKIQKKIKKAAQNGEYKCKVEYTIKYSWIRTLTDKQCAEGLGIAEYIAERLISEGYHLANFYRYKTHSGYKFVISAVINWNPEE